MRGSQSQSVRIRCQMLRHITICDSDIQQITPIPIPKFEVNGLRWLASTRCRYVVSDSLHQPSYVSTMMLCGLSIKS
jgi:hypothetical protein